MRSPRNQTITLWIKTGENGYGEETYAAPEVFQGRWENRSEQVRTPTDEEITSKAIIWVEEGIPIGSRLALGDYTGVDDPSLANASEVQAVFSVPSLRTNEMEHRAIL